MNRNRKERDRLRAKRKNPVYLANERARNQARMAKLRNRLRRKGLCVDCEQPSATYRCPPCLRINSGLSSDCRKRRISSELSVRKRSRSGHSLQTQ